MFRNKAPLNPPEEHSENPIKQGFSLPKLPHLKPMLLKTITVKNLFHKKPAINPQEEQQIKLMELGNKLRQIRTEEAISLEMIAKQTRIPIRLLKAIEAGDQENLPEPIYIRGLIKQFAEVLGLDGATMASTFPTQSIAKKNKSYLNLRLPSLHLRPIHLYFLYILLVILSVRGISHVLKQSTLDVESLAPYPQPTVQASPVKKIAPHSVKPAVAKPTPTQPVVVIIQLKDESWLKVTADGKTVFEGVLPKETKRTWAANQEVTIRAGNAGAVFVSFNHQPAKPLGNPGTIQAATYQKSEVRSQKREALRSR